MMKSKYRFVLSILTIVSVFAATIGVTSTWPGLFRGIVMAQDEEPHFTTEFGWRIASSRQREKTLISFSNQAINWYLKGRRMEKQSVL